MILQLAVYFVSYAADFWAVTAEDFCSWAPPLAAAARAPTAEEFAAWAAQKGAAATSDSTAEHSTEDKKSQ